MTWNQLGFASVVSDWSVRGPIEGKSKPKIRQNILVLAKQHDMTKKSHFGNYTYFAGLKQTALLCFLVIFFI